MTDSNGHHRKPLFSLGQVVSTPAAIQALEKSGQSPSDFLDRHVSGDWGAELCDDDRQLNDQSLIDGCRILSAYRTTNGVKLWVITEAADDSGQRAATTILLPEEY